MYTVADLEVLSLVSEMKRQGSTYADIHATLKSGQRGNAPELPPAELQIIAASDQERQLVLHIEYLQHTLAQVRTEFGVVKKEAATVYQLREEKAKLEATLEYTQRELEETKTALEQSRKQGLNLSKQLGEEYARGVMEALERRGDISKKAE